MFQPMASSSSSSSVRQTAVGVFFFSGCALLGYYYFHHSNGSRDNITGDDYGDDVDGVSRYLEGRKESCAVSVASSKAIASGMRRLHQIEGVDYKNFRLEANVYNHQVAGHTDESKLSTV